MQDLDIKTYFIYKVLLTRELVFVNQPHWKTLQATTVDFCKIK